jgi:hypothetical protein
MKKHELKQIIKEQILAEVQRTFTNDEMLNLVTLYPNLTKLKHNKHLYTAVKDKKQTDPAFYKKLTAHIINKTNRLPLGEPLIELEPVAAMRIPNNAALAKLMERDPKVKQDLINLSLQAIGPHTNDPNWNYVRKGWTKSELYIGTNYNIGDEIMLDDNEDDRLYLSVNPIDSTVYRFEINKLNYRGQTIYQAFY